MNEPEMLGWASRQTARIIMRRRGDESEMPSEQAVIVLEARSDGQSESIHGGSRVGDQGSTIIGPLLILRIPLALLSGRLLF